MWRLFLLIVIIHVIGVPSEEIVTVKTARCRVQCLKQTLKRSSEITDETCSKKRSCDRCWQMCSYLFHSYEFSSSICSNSDTCRRGCDVACQFREKQPQGNITDGWNFKGKKAIVQRLPHSQQVEITWPRPENDLISANNDLIVYVLLCRDKSDKKTEWTVIAQTSSHEVLLEQDGLPKVPEFQLLAIGENGTIADMSFSMDSSPIVKAFSPAIVTNPDYPVSGKKPIQVYEDSPIILNITLSEDPKTGTTSALVEWDHPPIDFMKPNILYDIHWLLIDCDDVYESSPVCRKTKDHHGNTIAFRESEKPHYKIDNLMFNSQYHVEVEMDKKWYGKVGFVTSECPDVDTKTFTICPSLTATNTSHTTAEDDRDHGDIMRWKVVEKRRQYNNHPGKISVLLGWDVPFNHSAVSSYTISVEAMSNELPIIKSTNKTEEWFELDENSVYSVQGVVVYKRDGKDDQIYSDLLDLKTTALSSVSSQKVVGSQWKDIDRIIVGVTVMVCVVLLGLIILFVYKKRHTFKDIIINKPAVAKSNSYKSNVGCKVDYSNQLLVLSDEWELDPCRLKFCTPIGQGAFGKVVTGYYDNKRVAIKLVRDSAPLSYKEDLLAEINLMKRIGSHPNIVSMLGACTLSEPIALAMEYIPFGNLQNFLKKCRMEGDFNKRAGHPTEVTYSIMDPNGDIDNGVITPADMLSFARQVAMAMEYLAEKKYVHRDLAARNVLLDYDKVVKVCDFGLSRDIFNDNQYHKVTSGKLPLKWMAIESLRDRVFTTQSDVWSFAILLYEIVTMGGSPYPHTALADLYYVLANGYRMEKPSNCSNELYAIMRQCWYENPKDRPSFTELRIQLEQLLSVDRNYLDLDNIDVPLSTSESSSNSVPKTDDRLSLISNKHAQAMKSTGVGKSSTGRQSRTITIPSLTRDSITVNVCGEQSNDWLIRGRDDETTT